MFSEEYLVFFKELAQYNKKEWFDENRKRYERFVKNPFKDFVTNLLVEIKKIDSEIEIEAKADILIEQAYQIEAASTLYTIGYDKPPKSMRDLMPDYIKKLEPPIDSVLGWFIIPENGFPAISLSSVESKNETNKKLCDSINKKGKIHNIRCENNYIYKLNQ